ncbi:hypothetical protein PybrP1_009096 [[Pythium] brassicae (nom. inval.)]|nr:hypothetical protein PybrP1_009096 [[Pythium] brassicae (nom. inval.)]
MVLHSLTYRRTATHNERLACRFLLLARRTTHAPFNRSIYASPFHLSCQKTHRRAGSRDALVARLLGLALLSTRLGLQQAHVQAEERHAHEEEREEARDEQQRLVQHERLRELERDLERHVVRRHDVLLADHDHRAADERRVQVRLAGRVRDRVHRERQVHLHVRAALWQDHLDREVVHGRAVERRRQVHLELEPVARAREHRVRRHRVAQVPLRLPAAEEREARLEEQLLPRARLAQARRRHVPDLVAVVHVHRVLR